MNLVLVGLTIVIMAWVLVSCAVLGADRLAAAEYISRDGIEASGPERGPLETGKGARHVDRTAEQPGRAEPSGDSDAR